jgi:hypothetical protein
MQGKHNIPWQSSVRLLRTSKKIYNDTHDLQRQGHDNEGGWAMVRRKASKKLSPIKLPASSRAGSFFFFFFFLVLAALQGPLALY